ncbi:hypothetical protein CSV75_04375 [Sporosarcina sp. P18a]|uniref:putative phage tail protein n=1 Tax=Sporosarcina sp. P18a TaxID=2048259 RepID=UPI000C167026|nr:putative phage tail protein [Sporosarcina sp. P18a]PIC81021.1 hypothetical protein CSV75_04375 [Sporosarcina sp. P18a]
MITAKESDIERRKQEMLDSLPPYYQESPEANAIIRGNASEIERKRSEAQDLLDQMFVSTATWGLDYWDRVFDLPPAPRMSTRKRRERIIAKLRGAAPATIKYLTNLVNSFVQNGDAHIEERARDYAFDAVIPIDGMNEIDTSDIYAAIEEVKPAHLVFGVIGTIRNTITVTGHAYDFPVVYPICNTFHTADIPGILADVATSVRAQSYAFDANYPICGTFVTSSVISQNEHINVILAAEYRTNDILYKRAGTIYAGEGEI